MLGVKSVFASRRARIREKKHESYQQPQARTNPILRSKCVEKRNAKEENKNSEIGTETDPHTDLQLCRRQLSYDFTKG